MDSCEVCSDNATCLKCKYDKYMKDNVCLECPKHNCLILYNKLAQVVKYFVKLAPF